LKPACCRAIHKAQGKDAQSADRAGGKGCFSDNYPFLPFSSAELGTNDRILREIQSKKILDLVYIRLIWVRSAPRYNAGAKRPRHTQRDKYMTASTIVVGLDGGEAGARALDFAAKQAKLIGDCELKLVYVIEWSPFSFQTSEENDQRHKRREEELALARERIVDPAVKKVSEEGVTVQGIVKHGDVADILDDLAKKHGAQQIVVGRVGLRGLKERMFGGVTGRLAVASRVPLTIIP
tara:strand:+ start:1071 stop:1781 length:711 start_codon:yes stop_codon:yes gene_type:complete